MLDSMRPCCFSLLLAVQMVAVVSMVLDGAGLGLFIMNLHSIATSVDKGNLTESSEYTTFNIVSLILGIAGTLLHFFLSILLFSGARHGNVWKCRIWCYGTLVLFVLIITNLSGIKLAIASGAILIHLYFLWVVYAHMQELKHGNIANRISSQPYTLFI